ncbi:MAG: SRPBCC family protein [Pirellulaceae bacterium]
MNAVSPVSVVRHPTRRGVYRLTTELRVPAPIDEVFPFFADALNLEEITPPWLNFRVLTTPPIEMRVGTLIDYKLRLHGVPVRWRTRISDWEPPHRFVDEQLRGPYRLWRHEHTFKALGEETLIRDQVDYRVPGGAIVHRLLVGRDVRMIFEYRHELLTNKWNRRTSSIESESSADIR